MRDMLPRLLLYGLGWCALGVVLLYALIRLGVLTENFPYKGVVVFAVTTLGVMLTGTRPRRCGGGGDGSGPARRE